MSQAPRLPFLIKAEIFLRLFAIQGAWNYETMLGNGIAFAMEPGLRFLPGGKGGEAYRAAMARHCTYFNAHPYLAGVAVGALLRAELDGVPAAHVERFRTALPGPLGSVGDRLVWAAWLPFCAVLALAAFGLGMGTAGVLLLFVGSYNAGAVTLRAWGIRAGFGRGLQVAQVLGAPVLRQAPAHLARGMALVAGFALPLAARGIIGPGRTLLGATLLAALVGAAALGRFARRSEGWRLALALLTALVLYAMVR
ncbi:MAG: PTS system mannose/fructose/sorbose family transporter subunit IID [Gemmatimonadaceae bacterium]|nr:PTS system mannose/fructose/sorbose family transporter subunit IID [Gemmatimonadaceae bacterium]